LPFALKLALYYEVARYVGTQVDSYFRGSGAEPHVIWRNDLVKHKGAIIVSYGHASTKQFFALPHGQDYKRIRRSTVDFECRGAEDLLPIFGK
jgi:hypothetical protein